MQNTYKRAYLGLLSVYIELFVGQNRHFLCNMSCTISFVTCSKTWSTMQAFREMNDFFFRSKKPDVICCSKSYFEGWFDGWRRIFLRFPFQVFKVFESNRAKALSSILGICTPNYAPFSKWKKYANFRAAQIIQWNMNTL